MTICAETERQQFFKKVNDCYWNPKLKVHVLANGDRTVITTQDIKDNEPLVILTKSSYFNSKNAFQHSKEDITLLEDNLVLPAYLYQFYTKHTDSFPVGYDHYFNALPTYKWYANNHELIKFYLSLNEEQKNKLKDNSFIIKMIVKLFDWAKQIPNHKPDIEQVIRSVIICVTRAWSNAGLVPWIDFFNHSVEGSPLKDASIHATHAYKKNEEVNTTYGSKDSLQLALVYGFIADEKTIAITRPPVSKFAIALDSDLNTYQTMFEEQPILVKNKLENFNYLLSYFRLCVLSKHDLFYVDDIASEYKEFINGDNEYKATKVGLYYINKTQIQLNEAKKNFFSVSEKLPKFLVEEFQVKSEILQKLKQKFYTHWLGLVHLEDKEGD